MIEVKPAYITTELCELLTVTRKAVLDRAKRESWASRPRKGRGGGNEWLLESMPASTRQAIGTAIASSIVAEKGKQYPGIAPVLFTVNTLNKVPEQKRERAAARALLVSMAREFQQSTGVSLTTAYETFSHEYNRHAIAVPDWVREQLKSVCRCSLINWEAAINKKGVASLAGKHGRHLIGGSVIDSTRGMADYIVAEIVEFYGVTAASVMEALEARFEGQRLPAMRSLQRWMKEYKEQNKQAIMKIQNPDAWRSKYQSAAGSRSEHIERANQLWEMDSSPTDIILADGKRYTLLGCIDVATRRGSLHLAKTSNSQGVCSLLRRALLIFGVPESLKIDNGADYTSVQVVTAVTDLAITPEWCTPFSPDEKPHIERFFKTFQHGFCVRLPGFIGHCVADRKAIESRRSFAERVSRKQNEQQPMEFRYTPEEFQAICDAWVEDNYNERVHSEIGMSPNDAAAKMGGTVRRITDERALDVLLMPLAGSQGIRVIGKKGIRADGGVYNAPLLGGLEGTMVQVRYDEYDAGYAYIFDLDGIFICRAEDPELTGVSRRDLALARKAHQRAVINHKVKEAKQIVAKVKPQETAAMILDLKARQAAEKRAARAEQQTEEYSTPALEQAALAAASQKFAEPAPMTPQEAENRRRLEEEWEWVKNNIPILQNVGQNDLASKEAFVTYQELVVRNNSGDKLTPAEVKWYLGYQNTIYINVHREMLADFGEVAYEGIKAFAIS